MYVCVCVCVSSISLNIATCTCTITVTSLFIPPHIELLLTRRAREGGSHTLTFALCGEHHKTWPPPPRSLLRYALFVEAIYLPWRIVLN